MTSPISKTIQVQFKGVPFFVETETQEGGRKVAVSEFPGSDERFVEDLGKRPGIFRIIGYVGGTDGEDWIQQEKALTTALNDPSEGILDLSVFGSIRVKAQHFSKTVSQNTLGRVGFNITFLVSTPNPSPTVAEASVETVATAAIDVMTTVEEVFAEQYEVPYDAATSLVSEYDEVQITDSISETISALGRDIDSVTSFANAIRDDINSLVRDPVAFASALFNDGLLGEVFDTIEVTRDALKSLSELTRVGYNLAKDFESIRDDAVSNAAESFDIPKFGDDTRYRLTNNNNRKTVINNTRIAVFAIYLNQACRNEYPTDEDINNTIADINEAYENIVLTADIDPITALVLDVCRIDAVAVLDGKLQTTPNVETLNLKTPTVDVELAYRLYTEQLLDADDLSDQAELLTDLNGVLPTRYRDDVLVLRS